MNLSQKCQYAIRPVLELSKYYGQGTIRISKIAEKQVIPPRFLENILNELKSTDLIDSRRGARCGYLLIKNPSEITVGEVIRLIDGPLDPVQCTIDQNKNKCPLKENCSLVRLWSRAKKAIEDVYDNTSFHDLVEQEKELSTNRYPDYCI
jgi:Rrf2 family transcriptional regulator, cysteine metabolism repressor